MPPTARDFRYELHSRMLRKHHDGEPYLETTSKHLAKAAGDVYPEPNHRMPVCCAVMKQEIQEGDEIICVPPSGQGATLKIRYKLDGREIRLATIHGRA